MCYMYVREAWAIEGGSGAGVEDGNQYSQSIK